MYTQTTWAGNACSYRIGKRVSYDLSDLTRQGLEGSYVITDGDVPCTTEVEQNFTWAFNVCGDVTLPPASCSDSAPAAMYQVTKTAASEADQICYVAGRYSKDSEEWSLAVPSEPAMGVKLTYYGDYCANDAAGEPNPTQRVTDLIFTCADKASATPSTAYEESHCHFSVTIPTWYGCPEQCPISGRRLCAGNGHCAYDTDAASARCFCDRGYTGDDCSHKGGSGRSNKSATSAASTVVTVIIIILFVVSLALGVTIFVMMRQVEAYKQDASNYMSLQGGDEGVTGV